MDETHPTFEEGLAAQREALAHSYAQALREDIVFEGAVFQADAASYAAMLSALHQPLPADFYWLDKANTKVPMDADTLRRLVHAVFLKRFAAFDTLQAAKAALRKASTVEALFAAPIAAALAPGA